MKKINSYLLLLCIALTIVSCSKKKEEAIKKEPPKKNYLAGAMDTAKEGAKVSDARNKKTADAAAEFKDE